MDVSENSGTPKSSILIGFSIINHIYFGVPLFLETPIYTYDTSNQDVTPICTGLQRTKRPPKKRTSGQIIATAHDLTPKGSQVAKEGKSFISAKLKSGLVKYHNLTRNMVLQVLSTLPCSPFGWLSLRVSRWGWIQGMSQRWPLSSCHHLEQWKKGPWLVRLYRELYSIPNIYGDF